MFIWDCSAGHLIRHLARKSYYRASIEQRSAHSGSQVDCTRAKSGMADSRNAGYPAGNISHYSGCSLIGS